MADITKMLTQPSTWSEVATKADNSAAVATRAAVVGAKHYITHIVVSVSAAPTGVASVTLEDGAGGTVRERIEIPAALFSPIVVNFVRPIELSKSTAAVATLPAVGGTTRGTITMKGFTIGL